MQSLAVIAGAALGAVWTVQSMWLRLRYSGENLWIWALMLMRVLFLLCIAAGLISGSRMAWQLAIACAVVGAVIRTPAMRGAPTDVELRARALRDESSP